MHSFTPTLAALTAWAIGVAGGVPLSAPSSSHDTWDSSSLKAYQSTVFGWQLAGSAANAHDLGRICTSLEQNQMSKWSQIGLSLPSIQTPVCKTLAPQPETALPEVAAANTKVFTTLLVNSFSASSKTTYSYLCDNLRYFQLDGFMLDSGTVTKAMCQLGGSLPSPRPFTPPVGSGGAAAVNKTAVDQFKSAQSNMFAYLQAAAAPSALGLQSMCAGYSQPSRQSAFDRLMLDGSCVKDTVCDVAQPVSVDEAKGQLRTWSSQAFLTVILNISNQPGYAEWLCHHLDAPGMDALGLDGHAVQAGVCAVAHPDQQDASPAAAWS